MPRSELIAFRRGTAAQWAAAAPILADGEPGYERDTGILRVGDGASAFASLDTVGARTDHDAFRWFAQDQVFEGTATYVPNSASRGVPPYWSFANAAEQYIKWCWQPETWWGTYTVRFGIVFAGAEGLANTRWQYSEERIVVNTDAGGGGSLIESPAEVAQVTVPPPGGALGTANRYADLAQDVAAVPVLTFVLSVLTRMGNDAVNDPYTGAAGVFLTTATRTGV